MMDAHHWLLTAGTSAAGSARNSGAVGAAISSRRNSVTGWHHALGFAGRPSDVVFDAHLTRARLRKYPIMVSPLAVAVYVEAFAPAMGTLFLNQLYP